VRPHPEIPSLPIREREGGKGEDKSAIAENRIMDVLRSIAPNGASLKKLVELLGGVMSRSTVDRALINLDKSGEVVKTKVKDGRTFRFIYSTLTKRG
jgi:predicted transcriptional regulator